MGDTVLLDPAVAPALAAAGLATADGLFALGGPLADPSVVRVIDLPVPGTDGRFHLKRYAYPGWRRARGLLGRGTLWGTAPEIREFRALAWMREHDVPAVRPIAAAARSRGGRLVAHVLLTEHVPDALDLAGRLRDPDDPVARRAGLRRRVLARLGAHLSTLHAQGFVHGDAHPRNVLVRLAGDGSGDVHLALLDCRRGGPASWRRGALDDLATLDLDLEAWVSRTDRLRVLRAWLPAGRPARAVVRRVARRRERLRRANLRRGRTPR